MAFLDISHLEKDFGSTRVVRDFSLAVEQGEFVSFLGPSGCGKTTVLRMVAGFETPTRGSIRIDGRDMVPLRPNQRNIGMVFQAYALFPNLTVAQNIAFGLRIAGIPRAEIATRVEEMLALIHLPDLGQRYPYQLSGGQQQRVALARALAVRPKVLLLDEPLSALDAKIRVSLRQEIRAIQRRLGITTIFVTHDQEEALSMSDRIVVMNGGVAEQVGDPFTVYNRPVTSFVANFVGTLTVLDATLTDPAAGLVDVGGQPVRLGRPVPAAAGTRLPLSLRPESLSPTGTGACTLTGQVTSVDFLGSVVRVRLAIAGQSLSFDMFSTPDTPPPAPGDSVTVRFDRDRILLPTA